MKTIQGALAGLMLLAAAAPAAAQHAGGGFHGGGFHGGGFHGGGFHGGHFGGGPVFGFGLGLGLGYGLGYPWYNSIYSDDFSYSDPYGYLSYYGEPYPSVPPDSTCGTWIWHPETYSYGWLACGATSETNVPMGAAPQDAIPPASAAPPAAQP